jgi:DNA-binding NtrC family response regulator
MALSTEINRTVDSNRLRPVNNLKPDHRPQLDYVLVEAEITDLVHAENRIEALRSLVLIFLREVESLKKVVTPRPRKKGDPISLDSEVNAFEATLIRDALTKTNGNQRDAAKLLKIKPSTLNAKMKRLGITVASAISIAS